MRLVKVRNNPQVQEVVIALSKDELSLLSKLATLSFLLDDEVALKDDVLEAKQELLDEKMVEELYHQSILKQQSHEGGEIR